MDKFSICILDGSNYLGREVCRLAVAMGHRVISVSKKGEPDEQNPWVEGVTWVTGDPKRPAAWKHHLEDCDALVDCSDALSAGDGPEAASAEVADAAHRAGIERFVYLAPAGTKTAAARDDGQLSMSTPIETAVLQPGPIDRGDLPSSPPLAAGSATSGVPSVARETVAIAALRAALEPDRTGTFDAAQVAHLGDAMFIQ